MEDPIEAGLSILASDAHASTLCDLPEFTRWTLLRQRRLEHHARNWRPHILIFSSNVKKDLEPIRLASAFSQGRGITTVCSLRLGDLDDLSDLSEEAERNDAFLSSKGVRAFCEVDVADNFESGLVTVTQANGIAGLQSNTVVFCWPSAETFPLQLMSIFLSTLFA